MVKSIIFGVHFPIEKANESDYKEIRLLLKKMVLRGVSD